MMVCVFFKQKTAYEMRISDGSSDVCSSELATAFLSPRTVRAIAAWREAAGIERGPIFRRVNVRRYKARAAVRGRKIDRISGREAWDLRKTLSKPAVPARDEYDVGEAALHPASRSEEHTSELQSLMRNSY